MLRWQLCSGGERSRTQTNKNYHSMRGFDWHCWMSVFVWLVRLCVCARAIPPGGRHLISALSRRKTGQYVSEEMCCGREQTLRPSDLPVGNRPKVSQCYCATSHLCSGPSEVKTEGRDLMGGKVKPEKRVLTRKCENATSKVCWFLSDVLQECKNKQLEDVSLQLHF